MNKSIAHLVILGMLLLGGVYQATALAPQANDLLKVKSSTTIDVIKQSGDVATISLKKSSIPSWSESPVEVEEEEDTDELVSCELPIEGYVCTMVPAPLHIHPYTHFSTATSCRYILLQVFRI